MGKAIPYDRSDGLNIFSDDWDNWDNPDDHMETRFKESVEGDTTKAHV